jgi:hypothetical protein
MLLLPVSKIATKTAIPPARKQKGTEAAKEAWLRE